MMLFDFLNRHNALHRCWDALTNQPTNYSSPEGKVFIGIGQTHKQRPSDITHIKNSKKNITKRSIGCDSTNRLRHWMNYSTAGKKITILIWNIHYYFCSCKARCFIAWLFSFVSFHHLFPIRWRRPRMASIRSPHPGPRTIWLYFFYPRSIQKSDPKVGAAAVCDILRLKFYIPD